MDDATQQETQQELLQKVLALFTSKSPSLGTPDEPTKEGYLLLARSGKDMWNAWRSKWPKPIPDFSGVDFKKNPVNFSEFCFTGGGDTDARNYKLPCVDFSQAAFGDRVDFTKATFGYGARFEKASFGYSAEFERAKFGDLANFTLATFSSARFPYATFGVGAIFDGATFCFSAYFYCSKFGPQARFEGVTFVNSVFTDSTFGPNASFSGAAFGGRTRFDFTEFGRIASFAAWDLARLREFRLRLFDDLVIVDAQFAADKKAGLSSDEFLEVTFNGAQFAGDVSFQDRKFRDRTSFGPTRQDMAKREYLPVRFGGIPNFHGCTLHQNTTFEDAKFDGRLSEETARAYRTLKLAFAQQQATREEQRFFRLEMQAEGGIAKGSRKLMFWLYDKLADYGFSFYRPFRLWIVSTCVFALIYGLMIGHLASSISEVDVHSTVLWAKFTLLNAIPLPGFDRILADMRTALFHGELMSSIAILVELLHKTVSLLAIFLEGLALRNLFKMKG
jgi:uncharacterized protein YjbI with pentapeptide repeats